MALGGVIALTDRRYRLAKRAQAQEVTPSSGTVEATA